MKEGKLVIKREDGVFPITKIGDRHFSIIKPGESEPEEFVLVRVGNGKAEYLHIGRHALTKNGPTSYFRFGTRRPRAGSASPRFARRKRPFLTVRAMREALTSPRAADSARMFFSIAAHSALSTWEGPDTVVR